MTVYVDNMRRPARPVGYRGRGTPNWSHMLADSHGELLTFAQQLGLNISWIQNKGTHREHFDVTDTIRTAAIKAGAKAISYPPGMANLLAARRESCLCNTLPDCTWGKLHP